MILYYLQRFARYMRRSSNICECTHLISDLHSAAGGALCFNGPYLTFEISRVIYNILNVLLVLPDHSTAQNCIGGAAHGGVTLDIPSAKMITKMFKMFPNIVDFDQNIRYTDRND